MIFNDFEIASLCCASQTCVNDEHHARCVERITTELMFDGYDQQEIDGVKIATIRYKGYTLIAHAFIPEELRGEGRLRRVMESLPQPVLYQPYMRQYESLIGKPIPKIVYLDYPSILGPKFDTTMSYFLFGSEKQKYKYPQLFVGDSGDEYIADSIQGVERELRAYYYTLKNGLF